MPRYIHGESYISRDVIFDENIFPFSKLHPNKGSRLRSEILLLPSHLLNNPRGESVVDKVSNDSNPIDFGEGTCGMQAKTGKEGECTRL